MISHQERYDKWAANYNKDVGARGYTAPEYMANYLMELITRQEITVSPENPDIKVLDVGCGTGLAGVALREKGFRHIDGLDHSQGMVVQAHKTGVYQSLIGWCNLQQELPFFLHNQYDLTVCCGVFALDFVTPLSLKWLVQVTKPGGFIVMNTNANWYKTNDFTDYYKKLEQSGYIKHIDSRMNEPYLGEEADGHYWAFSILDVKEKLSADD